MSLLEEIVRDEIKRQRRPPDGKLHPSSDLLGSLRHTQLRAAGAPEVERDLTSDVRMMTGTLWHKWFEDNFHRRRIPAMSEVKLDPWMPTGWSGTADWIIWDFEADAWGLKDVKTIKGEGIKWIVKDGTKDEYHWQTSLYWHALRRWNFGPLLNEIDIFYFPMNAVQGEIVEPVSTVVKPLPADLVLGVANDRWQATTKYLDALNHDPSKYQGFPPEAYLNEHLAPVQDRVQILRWVKDKKRWEVKLAPHWSAQYCPFPDELCDCNQAGMTLIGSWNLDGVYEPRKGEEFEGIEPAVRPDDRDIKKKREEFGSGNTSDEAVVI